MPQWYCEWHQAVNGLQRSMMVAGGSALREPRSWEPRSWDTRPCPTLSRRVDQPSSRPTRRSRRPRGLLGRRTGVVAPHGLGIGRTTRILSRAGVTLLDRRLTEREVRQANEELIKAGIALRPGPANVGVCASGRWSTVLAIHAHHDGRIQNILDAFSATQPNPGVDRYVVHTRFRCYVIAGDFDKLDVMLDAANGMGDEWGFLAEPPAVDLLKTLPARHIDRALAGMPAPCHPFRIAARARDRRLPTVEFAAGSSPPPMSPTSGSSKAGSTTPSGCLRGCPPPRATPSPCGRGLAVDARSGCDAPRRQRRRPRRDRRRHRRGEGGDAQNATCFRSMPRLRWPCSR